MRMLETHHSTVTIIFLLCLFAVGSNSQCNNSGAVSLSSQYSNFTKANQITFLEEQTVFTVYGSLSSIGSYSVSLSSAIKIYTNL